MATSEQIALALQGFGAGVQGQLPQFQAGLANRKKQEEQLSAKRKAALAQDALGAQRLLDSGDMQGTLNLLENRLSGIQQLGGDPADTLALRDKILSGDIQGASNDLGLVVNRARAVGVLPELAKAEQFTLSPGQVRFEAGKEIARVDKKVDPDRDLDLQTKKLKLEEVKASIANKNAIAEERKVKAIQAADQKDSAQVAQAFEAQTAIEAVNSLIDGDSFRSIYGAGDDFIPTILPGSVTAEAQRDQLIGLLSLESRQKLKGQGTISDSESKTLGQSATILARAGISEKAAENELKRVKKTFQRAMNRAAKNPAAAEAIRAASAESQSGSVLRFDAQGNPI